MNNSLLVKITPFAKDDIATIADYIADDNKLAAKRFVSELEKIFDMLSQFPNAGTSRFAIKDKKVLAYTIKKNFTVIYRYNKTQLEILRVLTKYQDIFAVLWLPKFVTTAIIEIGIM